MRSSCSGAFVRDSAVSRKVLWHGGKWRCLCLKGPLQRQHSGRGEPILSAPSPLHGTAAQFYLCIRLAEGAKIFWSLQTSSCLVKLSCQMRRVLSLWVNKVQFWISRKNPKEGRYLPLYTWKVPYGSVGACSEMCWLSWPVSALLGTLMELWGCFLRVWCA